MTLSRSRRIATGLAAGLAVLCAAFIGASLRPGDTEVASVSRPATPIAIVDDGATDSEPAAIDDPVRVIDVEDLPDEADLAETDTNNLATPDPNAESSDPAGQDTGTSDPDDPADDSAVQDSTAQDSAPEDSATQDQTPAPEDSATQDSATQDQTPAPSAPPLTAASDALGTGGGVNDAECALDRLVIYGGARVGGVGASLRNAIVNTGFGAGCSAPIEIRASNCPLQFSGVLGTGSGYDPTQSFVASSTSVDRETLTAVLNQVGYSGTSIDILDFSFVRADEPGEQWIAIFVPPSFAGWERLSNAAGLNATTQSLCAPSGELG